MYYTSGLGRGYVVDDTTKQARKVHDDEVLIYRFALEMPKWFSVTEFENITGIPYIKPSYEFEVGLMLEALGLYYGFAKLDMFPTLYKLDDKLIKEWNK